MSPEAITSRLRTMDELWLLSQKLMNSKRILNDDEAKRVRAAEIQDSIGQILFRDWDPIGISNDSEWPNDEYDSYIAPVYRILSESRSEDELVHYLFRTEKQTMGMSCEDAELLRPVARKLLALDVSFESAK
ncbi:MAG TPA: hypothetical protein VK468_05755 [Pyrinomonadaceae bacterium]|nr:hypothetical protein [Pyrinomonadaceae bacterium]